MAEKTSPAVAKTSGKPEEAHLTKSKVAPDLQKKADEASEKGYYGTAVDPTPNENYSLETPPTAPTPETDLKAAEKAHTHGLKSKFGKEA